MQKRPGRTYGKTVRQLSHPGHRAGPGFVLVSAALLASFVSTSALTPALAEPLLDLSAVTSSTASYTDNVFVTVTPESDFILSADVAVQALAETRRSRINFRYKIAYDAYADADELAGFRHDLQTTNNFVLVEDFLFVNVLGAIRERNASSNLSSPAMERTINSNRTSVFSGTINPYIETSIGIWADVRADIQYTAIKFEDPDVGGSVSVQDDDQIWSGNFNVRGRERGKRWNWELYGRASQDDDDFETMDGGGVLRMIVGPNVTLLGRGGYDRSEGRANNLDIDEPYWRVGLEFEPIRDAYVRLEAGERYGGTNYDAEIRYQVAEKILLRASFTQILETDQRRFAGDLSGIEFDEAGLPLPSPVIDNDLTGASTISETGRVSLLGTVGKFDYMLSAYNMRREYDQFSSPGTFAEDEINGVSFSLSRRFGRRTGLGLVMDWEDNNALTPGSAIDSLRGRVFASYDIGRTAQISASYAYSSREDGLGAEVEENAVLIMISNRW